MSHSILQVINIGGGNGLGSILVVGMAWDQYWWWEWPGINTGGGNGLGSILVVGMAWDQYWWWEWPGKEARKRRLTESNPAACLHFLIVSNVGPELNMIQLASLNGY